MKQQVKIHQQQMGVKQEEKKWVRKIHLRQGWEKNITDMANVRYIT